MCYQRFDDTVVAYFVPGNICVVPGVALSRSLWPQSLTLSRIRHRYGRCECLMPMGGNDDVM